MKRSRVFLKKWSRVLSNTKSAMPYSTGTLNFIGSDSPRSYRKPGRRAGLDLPALQQLVYLLSVAIKDEEVIRLLSQLGVGLYQMRLLEYLLVDTEEEKQTWEMIRDHAALRLLGMAVFLKTCLPIETMAEVGCSGGRSADRKMGGGLFLAHRSGKKGFKGFCPVRHWVAFQ